MLAYPRSSRPLQVGSGRYPSLWLWAGRWWGVRALEVLGLRALGLLWLDFGLDCGLDLAWISV